MSTDLSVQALIDAAIGMASACVRHRMFLHTIDWSKSAPAQVERLLAALAEAGVALPPWLAKALLLGGHALNGAVHDALPQDLRALNTINRRDGAALAAAAGDLAVDAGLDAEVLACAVMVLVAQSQGALAVKLALAHWPRAPRALRFAAKAMGAALAGLPPAKLRLLGFSTTDALKEELTPAFAALGWRAEASQANFGEVIPELLRPAGDADAYFLLLDPLSLHARDWRLASEDAAALLEDKLGGIVSAAEHFVRESGRPLFITTLPAPPAPAAGLIDGRHTGGAQWFADAVNRRLSELAAGNAQVILIDTAQAFADIAPSHVSDPKLWFYGRFAYSPDATRALAAAAARAWNLLKRGPAKVLAIDLDNTMWGGVFGEDGVAALACGDDPPGNAFKAMQEECLRLKGQGFLLTLLSKNNPDAITAFADHPGMVLRESDFVATAINWEPKPDNVRRLAEELNLGLDSFIFLDDSPHEREAMRRLCPSVLVPELPADPARRPSWLRTIAATWPVRLTEEDERRSNMYAADRKAKTLRQQSASLDDYLAGLEQRLVIECGTPRTLPRIAQMHLRTNQFNLTTARFGEADIGAMLDDNMRHAVLLGRLTDKFGDHGIIIAATARLDGTSAEILSFLMSCRVIGREVERAFLGELIGFLRKRGISAIEAAYIPTAKNAMVREFYPRNGFTARGADGERQLWTWNAGEADAPRSGFVDVHWEA